MTRNTFSSSMTSKAVPLVEKRKKTMFSKEAGEAKGENKRKKPNGSFINSEEKRTDLSQVKKGKEAKSNHYEQAPTGYVHVRARRGQATDSHSLAERARREKIRERLQFLQSLVPGCDQITGKAQILDEIIKYVQSLQYQVECLSAKLASLNSTLIDFEVDPQAPYQWKCCLEPSLSASLVLKEDQKSALVFQDDAVLFSSQDYQNQNNIPLQYLHNSYMDF